MRTMGLVSMVAGAVLLISCAEPADAPGETLTYARGAAEVGMVDLSEMANFEASVERMGVVERSELWLRLSELHESFHPREAPAALQAEPIEIEPNPNDPPCSPRRCSHSTECKPMWCCAFGEDAVYYGDGGCPWQQQ